MSIFEQRPERFQAAVRAACCDACNWPECGCETTADVLRKGITAWELFGFKTVTGTPSREPLGSYTIQGTHGNAS